MGSALTRPTLHGQNLGRGGVEVWGVGGLRLRWRGTPGQERREPLTASVGAEANLTPTFQKELKLVVHHNVRIHTFSLH